MASINLRDHFKEYELDCFVDVSDGEEEAFLAALTKEIADVYVNYRRKEIAYRRRKYRYQAHFSLDWGDGIENTSIDRARSPEEILLERLTERQFRSAIAALPEKQGRRIYQHYYLGISKVDIAQAECVDESTVRESILLGIEKIKKYLKNF